MTSLKPLVTSVTASSWYSADWVPANLVDGYTTDLGHGWAVVAGSLPATVTVDFSATVTMASYLVWPDWRLDQGPNSPVAWVLDASTDGTTWTTIDSQAGQSLPLAASTTYTLAAPATFAHLRFTWTANGGGPSLNVMELDFMAPDVPAGTVAFAGTAGLAGDGVRVATGALALAGGGTLTVAPAAPVAAGGGPLHLPVEVRVYGPAGTGDYVVLPRRSGVQFSTGINDAGSGQVSVPFDDKALADHAGLLDWGAVVAYATTGPDGTYFEFASFIIEQRTIELAKSGESYDRMVTVSGRGPRSVLENALVLPFDSLTANSVLPSWPNTAPTATPSGRPRRVASRPDVVPFGNAQSRCALRKTSQTDRFFGWMSATSSWMVAEEWQPPQESTIAARMHVPPQGWPDPKALYIWPAPSGVRSTVPGGRALFRASFTLAEQADVIIHTVGDNALRLFVDEQQVLTSSDFKQTATTERITLGFGEHLLAAEVTNWLSDPGIYNPAGLLLTVVNADTNIAVLRSGTDGWLATRMILDGDPWVPGQSAAGVLIELMDEAADRGTAGIAGMARDFTDKLDSNGYPWPDHVERSFSVGTDLGNVADQLAEVAFDLRVTPDRLVHAYLYQGDDFSAGAGPVVLREGANLAAFGITEGGTKPRTHLLTRDQAGWTETDSYAARERYGYIEGYVELGTSASEAHTKVVASEALPTLGRMDSTATATMTAVPGSVPLWDFDIGDRVLVPDGSGALVPAEVLTIAGQENEAGTDIAWTVELRMLRTVVPGGHPATEEIAVEAGVRFASTTPLDMFGDTSAVAAATLTLAASLGWAVAPL